LLSKKPFKYSAIRGFLDKNKEKFTASDVQEIATIFGDNEKILKNTHVKTLQELTISLWKVYKHNINKFSSNTQTELFCTILVNNFELKYFRNRRITNIRVELVDKLNLSSDEVLQLYQNILQRRTNLSTNTGFHNTFELADHIVNKFGSKLSEQHDDNLFEAWNLISKKEQHCKSFIPKSVIAKTQQTFMNFLTKYNKAGLIAKIKAESAIISAPKQVTTKPSNPPSPSISSNNSPSTSYEFSSRVSTAVSNTTQTVTNSVNAGYNRLDSAARGLVETPSTTETVIRDVRETANAAFGAVKNTSKKVVNYFDPALLPDYYYRKSEGTRNAITLGSAALTFIIKYSKTKSFIKSAFYTAIIVGVNRFGWSIYAECEANNLNAESILKAGKNTFCPVYSSDQGLINRAESNLREMAEKGRNFASNVRA